MNKITNDFINMIGTDNFNLYEYLRDAENLENV